MKKIFYVLVLFVSIYSRAQEKEFTFTAEKGMTDFVVTSIEDKTANDIYKKVIDWIKVKYKNPEKAILSKNENESVRFEGESETLYSYNSLLGRVYEKTKYQIEVSIKDGKYKFDLIGMQYYTPTNKSVIGGWKEISFLNKNLSKKELDELFQKDGTFKDTWKNLPEVPKFFNDLNISLKEYIISNTKKNDNW